MKGLRALVEPRQGRWSDDREFIVVAVTTGQEFAGSEEQFWIDCSYEQKCKTIVRLTQDKKAVAQHTCNRVLSPSSKPCEMCLAYRNKT